MSVRRTLVECVVLSLKDTCVFYPCCKGCFSRINVEQQGRARCRCPRCGYSCSRDLVDYRYRLSLTVNRDECIFGVTVFGSCLNPFFGIHASGLQRLVENLDGPVGTSTRSMLLLKAVKDCFVGRHFIFGIKLTETESGLWSGNPVGNVSVSNDGLHFIASQMILPKAAGLEGCTVISYYQVLLQKAAEYELESADSSKASRPPPTTLLLIPHHSPASSFNSDAFGSSDRLSQCLLRSCFQDSVLTPSPPWQQSLGLVTSSAEQVEGHSSQDSGDDESRKTDVLNTPPPALRGCLQDHKCTEETELSPLVSSQRSSDIHLPLATYTHSFTENTEVSLSSPGHNSRKKGFSIEHLIETLSPSSVVWEDLPFSESLSEFFCGENNYFDIVREMVPNGNMQNHKHMPNNNIDIKLQDKHFNQSRCVSQSKIQRADGHSLILQDIINTPAPNGEDRLVLSDQVCKTPGRSVNKSQAKNICPHECIQDNEKTTLLSFKSEKEQLEEDAYNCSADLFSNSLTSDIIMYTFGTHAEAVMETPRTGTLSSKLDKHHLSSEKTDTPHSAPDKQRPKRKKCIRRDSLIPPGTQDLEFIPPSQSTPIVKTAVVSSYRSLTVSEFSTRPDSPAFQRNLPELGCRPIRATSTLYRLNCINANHLCKCPQESMKENLVCSSISARHDNRFTPKRRFWKPAKNKKQLLAQQHLKVQKEPLNTVSTGRINHKFALSDCDVAVMCDFEDSIDIIVSPTPAKEDQCVKRSDNSRAAPYQTLTSSQREQAQTGKCHSEAVSEASPNTSNSYVLEENEPCDWSRDLFSDSV